MCSLIADSNKKLGLVSSLAAHTLHQIRLVAVPVPAIERRKQLALTSCRLQGMGFDELLSKWAGNSELVRHSVAGPPPPPVSTIVLQQHCRQ